MKCSNCGSLEITEKEIDISLLPENKQKNYSGNIIKVYQCKNCLIFSDNKDLFSDHPPTFCYVS